MTANKKTLVLGATPDESRYANLASNRLVNHGHTIVNCAKHGLL